jgi:hypothetical protein
MEGLGTSEKGRKVGKRAEALWVRIKISLLKKGQKERPTHSWP